MQQMIDEVIDRMREQMADLGECCGIEYRGSALYDFKDAEPCQNDAVVVLIDTEFRGLHLCARCYRKHQLQVELEAL